jgi:hypothetical protein
MNEQRIREIANQCSDFAEQIPFYRGVEDGLIWEAKIQKARDLKFAELIVKECLMLLYERQQMAPSDDDGYFKTALDMVYDDIEQHFGVE